MDLVVRKPVKGAARDRVLRLNAQLTGFLQFEARLPKQIALTDGERATIRSANGICKSLLTGIPE